MKTRLNAKTMEVEQLRESLKKAEELNEKTETELTKEVRVTRELLEAAVTDPTNYQPVQVNEKLLELLQYKIEAQK